MRNEVIARILMVYLARLRRYKELWICNHALGDDWYWRVFVRYLEITLWNREIYWLLDLLTISSTDRLLFRILFPLHQIETFRFTQQILIQMRSCDWHSVRSQNVLKRMRVVSLQSSWENFAGASSNCFDIVVDQTPIAGFLPRCFKLVQRFGCTS